MKNQEADTVVQHFRSVCYQFGYPVEVVSDRGSQYTSSDFQELRLRFNIIIHKPGTPPHPTPHSQWKNGRCVGGLRGYLSCPRKKKQPWKTVLVNVCDTPLDANTPSPYELMFHGKIKSDLPSIPFSLFDSTNSINAGHKSVKRAERTNESENRAGESPRLEQHQTVMFMKKRRPDGQAGQSSQWTVNYHTPWRTTQLERNIPETESTSSQFPVTPPLHSLRKLLRKEEKKVYQRKLKCQSTKDTASPPKPKAETPMKQKADNPSDNIKTSRTRRVIKAPVKYGYE